MSDIPTYYDIKFQNSSKIFESEEIKGLTPDQIEEAEKNYYKLLEALKNGEPIDEGFWSGLAGAAAGVLIGPAIGKAICSVLGIDEKGHFGKLLTSKLVTGAIGATLAK